MENELIYSFSRTQKVNYLYTLFEVIRTAYYRYRREESHNADKKYNQPGPKIRVEFIQNWKRYGSRRIQESLKQKGITIGRRKVSEIMRKECLRAINGSGRPSREFIPGTTNSGHGKRVSTNLLLGQPKPSKPNCVWVSDIT
jgi:putative transposase